MGELYRMVHEAFSRPGDLEPAIPHVGRRACLKLMHRPALANESMWIAFGPAARGEDTCIVRRLVWRKDLDGDRGNPMTRLRRLGQDLKPTIEIADGTIEMDDLQSQLETFPSLGAASQFSRRGITLDGTRCSIELDSGYGSWRHAWLGVESDWTPANDLHRNMASWASRFCAWLDAALDSE